MKRVQIKADISDIELQVILDVDGNVIQIEGVVEYGEVDDFEIIDVLGEVN